MSPSALERAVAGWNRSHLDLASDEVLAQVLDRGDIEAWRELYQLASTDGTLRRRILGVVQRVPLPYPAFWLAALASPSTGRSAFPGTTEWLRTSGLPEAFERGLRGGFECLGGRRAPPDPPQPLRPVRGPVEVQQDEDAR
jgi:hypothetical protein